MPLLMHTTTNVLYETIRHECRTRHGVVTVVVMPDPFQDREPIVCVEYVGHDGAFTGQRVRIERPVHVEPEQPKPKPLPKPKLCEECCVNDRVQGERFCPECKRSVLTKIRNSTYYASIPSRAAIHEQRDRPQLDWRVLGGSPAEMLSKAD